MERKSSEIYGILLKEILEASNALTYENAFMYKTPFKYKTLVLFPNYECLIRPPNR